MGSDAEGLIMERNKDYQLKDMVFEILVWLAVIVVFYFDIKTTLF